MINPWDIDSELNPTGIEQANKIGKELQSEGYIFDIIIAFNKDENNNSVHTNEQGRYKESHQ